VLCLQDMLKSFMRSSILSKLSNGTYCCLRHFYEKMQQGQGYSKNKDLDRKWIAIDQTKKPGHTFSVLNYNILSQQLLEQHSYLYQDHNKNALNWSARLYCIIGEIFHKNPSILCLQVRKNK
jgi:mRNA deadenylase 3'-5' endonuclease subunit Ccr4